MTFLLIILGVCYTETVVLKCEFSLSCFLLNHVKDLALGLLRTELSSLPGMDTDCSLLHMGLDLSSFIAADRGDLLGEIKPKNKQ